MSELPRSVGYLELLNWVASNPNQPFDPPMVVSLSSGHTGDPEWHAVQVQMEYLKSRGYINRVKQDAAGSTYWQITPSGERRHRP